MKLAIAALFAVVAAAAANDPYKPAPYHQPAPYKAEPYKADPYKPAPYKADPYKADHYKADPYKADPYKHQGYKHEEYHHQPAKYQFKYHVKDEKAYLDFGHEEKRDYDVTDGHYFVKYWPGESFQHVTYHIGGGGYKTDSYKPDPYKG